MSKENVICVRNILFLKPVSEAHGSEVENEEGAEVTFFSNQISLQVYVILSEDKRVTITLSASADDKAMAIAEQIADLFGWVPDFEDQVGDVNLTVELKDKPNSTSETIGPYAISTTTEKVDMRNSARTMSFKMRSNVLSGHFRMGKNRIDIAPAGRRR